LNFLHLGKISHPLEKSQHRTLERISKLILAIAGIICVIPAQAGIHVFQGVTWTPLLTAGRQVRESDRIFAKVDFETGSVRFLLGWLRSISTSHQEVSNRDFFCPS
jgi:hypothetical protein